MGSNDICDQCLLAVGAINGDSFILGEKLTATRQITNLWDGLALLQKSSTRVVWGLGRCMESFSNAAFNFVAVLIDASLNVDLFTIEFKGKPICLGFVPIAVNSNSWEYRQERSMRECPNIKYFLNIQSRAAG